MEERRERIAFQGEMGAFSAEAAQRMIGREIELVPCETFEEMFAITEQGGCDACLAPIENSLFGPVHQNLDLLLRHSLTIVGETYLRIVHNLIVPPGTSFAEVREVFSHPVALGQCRTFFARHPQLKAMAAADTAGSVRRVMAGAEPGAAAIAGQQAAEVYGATVLLEGIEDDPLNFTRFFLLIKAGRSAPPFPTSSTTDKTSIVFTLENRTGSLYRAMAAFALREIDLTKIESRPIHGHPWEYSFYLDFLGHPQEPHVARALAHLSEFAKGVRVLGTYRRAVSGTSLPNDPLPSPPHP
jgi:prephenate dehydratase